MAKENTFRVVTLEDLMRKHEVTSIHSLEAVLLFGKMTTENSLAKMDPKVLQSEYYKDLCKDIVLFSKMLETGCHKAEVTEKYFRLFE